MSESTMNRRIAGTARNAALEVGDDVRTRGAQPQRRPVLTLPAPAPRAATPPAPALEFVSNRVPVPKSDFHESQHDRLHHVMMGEEFDRPEAAGFVRDAYRLLRSRHPDVHPSHVLATARDAWHAADLGLMHPADVVRSMHLVVRRRHRMTGP